MIADVGAELEVIGSAMYAPDLCEVAFERLSVEHFAEPLFQRTWAQVRTLRAEGHSLDPRVIAHRLGDDPTFAEMGGTRLLFDAIDKASPAAISGLTDLLCDLHTRREVETLTRATLASALDTSSGSATQLINDLERGAGRIAQTTSTAESWTSGTEVIRRAVQHARTRAGAMTCITGLPSVDDLIGGFNKGEVALIAGRPGMAKSLVASQIAKANAALGRGVAFFSKEMNEEQLGLRLACDLAYQDGAPVFSSAPDAGNPTFDAARKAQLSDEQWARLSDAGLTISTWPLMFDTRPGLTLSTIEACTRRLIRSWDRQGVERGVVIIDHLGLIRPEKERQGNKVAETGDISRGLAEMAKRLDMPVVALCQLSRATESRGDDKRPGLSDLRWAGELEQDARLVVFPYRPEYYYRPPLDPQSEDAQQRAERETKRRAVANRLYWIIAKNNNGPMGQVETFIDVSRAAIREVRR